MEEKNKMKWPYVDVDGVKVFKADYVFSQMTYQSGRIDTAKSIALTACIIAVAAVGIAIYALCR